MPSSFLPLDAVLESIHANLCSVCHIIQATRQSGVQPQRQSKRVQKAALCDSVRCTSLVHARFVMHES